MRIALFSDLHLEFNKSLVLNAPDCDLIVLAGDVGPVQVALEFAQRLAHQEQVPVIYVPGNHEYYGQDLEQLNQYLKEWKDPAGLVQVLLERAVTIGGIRFVGTTLWTDFKLRGEEAAAMAIEAAEKFLPDFKLIKRGTEVLRATDVVELHQQARQFLEEALAKPVPTVVISHFAPHADCCAPQFIESPITPCFITDCQDLIERFQPLCWLFGHTHHSVDFQVGTTRIVANQHGYPHEVGRTSGYSGTHRILLDAVV